MPEYIPVHIKTKTIYTKGQFMVSVAFRQTRDLLLLILRNMKMISDRQKKMKKKKRRKLLQCLLYLTENHEKVKIINQYESEHKCLVHLQLLLREHDKRHTDSLFPTGT